MTASYPVIVRKFTPHVDGTEYVMAAHMNDAQDEITALENTLGVQPQMYTPVSGSPTVYSSVGSRMNTVQREQDAQQTQINGLVSASQTGWSLPIASVQATGTSIPPTADTSSVQPSDWHSLAWNSLVLDTGGIYAPGTILTIPQTGWWIVTSRVMMHDPTVSDTVDHILWGRVRVLSTHPGQVTEYDLAAADSSAPGAAQGWHRLSMTCAWNFYAGDQVIIQLRHDFLPTNTGQSTPTKSTQVGMSRSQLTYVRGLPTGNTGAVVQFPDEAGT